MTDRLWDHGDQYRGDDLDPAACPEQPFILFRTWFADAMRVAPDKVNAMTLATVDDRGRPSARMVLLKELDDRGYVFFTNYDSRKGRALSAHPIAALVFYWPALDRQVRIVGAVERVTGGESDAYFHARPRASRVAAVASPQSHVLGSRAELTDRVEQIEAGLAGVDPERPPHWGGYRVVPDTVEFWQGQPSRLHDRVEYVRSPDGSWSRSRLAP